VERSPFADGGESQVMKATLRWIVTNSPLMVLALILGILAWVVAVEEGDPTVEELFSEVIPIELSDLPEGMMIVGEFDEYVEVTVRAPQSVWNSLKAEDFTIFVDLVNLNAGEHQVPIECTLDKHPALVVSIEPEYVTLKLEPRAEQTVPVQVETRGEPTLGYLMHTLTVVPDQVTVSGPSTYVARVVKATTQVSVQDASADIEGEYDVRIRDSEGRSVPYVTWSVDKVHVRIPVELSIRYRPLVVKVVLTGEYAAGYRITEIAVEPSSVTVFGAPGIVAALPGFIETEPISLEGAQDDVVAQPSLNVPPNVSVIMDGQPIVTVSIEPIQSSQTAVITPEIQGLNPGFTFTVSPDTVEVILSGPLPLLDTLEPDDVRVVLDIFDLSVGTHQIEPQIVVPEGVTAQSINPATVQVEIFVEQTPTPGRDEQP
jgi:YbbR domain-containing protein